MRLAPSRGLNHRRPWERAWRLRASRDRQKELVEQPEVAQLQAGQERPPLEGTPEQRRVLRPRSDQLQGRWHQRTELTPILAAKRGGGARAGAAEKSCRSSSSPPNLAAVLTAGEAAGAAADTGRGAGYSISDHPGGLKFLLLTFRAAAAEAAGGAAAFEAGPLAPPRNLTSARAKASLTLPICSSATPST